MIEYDWKKYHSGAKKRRDKLRDEYFENRKRISGRKNYITYRINSDLRHLESNLL